MKDVYKKDKKSFYLLLLGILVIITMVVGATFAYFSAQGGGSTTRNVNVTSNTTDLLTFEIENDISFRVTQADFVSGGNNKSGSTTTRAILRPNNNTGEATEHYYMYLNIENNGIEYSEENTNKDPELMLTVKDGSNNIITLSGLGEQKTVKGVTGYDITGLTGVKALLSNYEISASNNQITTQNWEVTITLINLDVNQNDNTNKEVNASIILQKEEIEIYPDPTSTACFYGEDNGDGTMTITGYDYENCSKDVVIPMTIDMTELHQISNNNIDTSHNPSTLNDITSEARISQLANANTRTVTTIGDSAFYNIDLTSVIMPNTITTIGEQAFNLNYLTEIVIPSSVTSIGSAAFGCGDDYDNNALSTITINMSDLSNIGDYAFAVDTDYTLIINNATEIPSNFKRTIHGGQNLTIVSSSLTTIDIDAFSAFNIVNLVLPASVTTIGDYAFMSSPLTSLTIPTNSHLTTIGEHAFESSGLTSFVLPASVTTIGDYAFGSTDFTSLTIPTNSHLTTIGEYAFASSGLTSFVLPASVTTIGDSAFQNTSLTSLTIPSNSNLTTIGYYAFESANLTSLDLPASVTTIDSYAFMSSPLTSLTIPTNSHLTTIGEHAFENANLTSLVLPSSLYTIGYDAFRNSHLTSLTIPTNSNLSTIENNAFENANLTSLYLPSSISYIGSDAFRNSHLTSLTIDKPCSEIMGMSMDFSSTSIGTLIGSDGVCDFDW